MTHWPSVQSQELPIDMTLISGGETFVFHAGPCGFGFAESWETMYEKSVCGPLVWARSIKGDSLVCDSIAGSSLTGHIAVARRGWCETILKGANVERAGGSAIIVLNHYNVATDDDCHISFMWGEPFTQVQIPAFGASRQMGEVVTNALNRGDAYMCIRMWRMSDAVAAYHQRTPLDQRDTLRHIGLRYYNFGPDERKGVAVKASVTDPNGHTTDLRVEIGSMFVGQDTFVHFPAYLPPPVVGRYQVMFTDNQPPEKDGTDTLYNYFYLTNCDFGQDEGPLRQAGLKISPPALAVPNADVEIGQAVLYRTGPRGSRVTGAAFGLMNASALIPPRSPQELDLLFCLYDADANDDGQCDIDFYNQPNVHFQDMESLLMAATIYTVTGQEPNDSFTRVALGTAADPSQPIVLKPEHAYYLAVRYADIAGNSIYPAFAATPPVREAVADSFTPRLLYTWWRGMTTVRPEQPALVLRLLTEDDPKCAEATTALSAFSSERLCLYPNPADDRVCLTLPESVREGGHLRLTDSRGQLVGGQRVALTEQGICLETAALLPGMYAVIWYDDSGKRRVAGRFVKKR